MNKRLYLLSNKKNVKISPFDGGLYDIIFILETNLAYSALPEIDNYTVLCNSDRYCKQGGIAVYLKDDIATHIFDVTYNECYIMFRLDFAPSRMFGGVYIYHERSVNYDDKMFADVDELLIKCNERGIIPFIGGDFNARVGDLNSFTGYSWKYEENCDLTTNSHGRTMMKDICRRNKMYPINHLKYRRKVFNGDFTFIRDGNKSQIDFVITSSLGRNELVSFEVLKTNWHMSDHRPVTVQINTDCEIRTDVLLMRAANLNEVSNEAINVKRFNKEYNLSKIDNYIIENKEVIEREIMVAIEQNDTDLAVERFNSHMESMHRISKYKKNVVNNSLHSRLMANANTNFKNFILNIHDGANSDETEEMLKHYIESRKQVTGYMMSSELEEWKRVMSNNSNQDVWKKINWKGEVKSANKIHPTINELKEHFEDIYTDEDNSLKNIDDLVSDVYIPVLDDPITSSEVHDSMKKCKKGGYDFPIASTKKFVQVFMPIILLLMNTIFYGYYPIKLAYSLLFSIPKKGNLRLPKNFRGIQMLPTLGVLYDRILYGRLMKWLNIHDEQTGFQKGKSTTHQIFTIRLLISLAKYMKIPLYIGCFDVEKAFDKVSRYILLKKLIKYGIGHCMLNALKSIYSHTSCILTLKGKYSAAFPTESGIRQGASSSSLLFIAFINDLVDFIRERCDPEPLLDSLHCLLHADDTLIISTSRSLFIKKCNLMNEYFDNNQLNLNLGKSGYLFVNGKIDDVKCRIELDKGFLDYKKQLIYLGVMISDTGNIKEDITSLVDDKRSNVTIKFTNFCAKNFLAPLDIKFNVLRSCVTSSLLYSCETWSFCIPDGIEVAFRRGIKTALNIRKNCCNEVTYLESGMYPLVCEVSKRQLKFWKTINSDGNELAYISRLIDLGKNTNLPFIKHYIELERKHVTPEKCVNNLHQEYQLTWKNKCQEAFNNDKDSSLGAYVIINPLFCTPAYSDDLLEYERVIITRLRTGSHNLYIETGRFKNPRVPREERKCVCDTGVQTVEHVIINCPLLQHLRVDNIHSVSDYINSKYIIKFMINAAKILRIKL